MLRHILEDLNKPLCTLFAKTLGDKILCHFTKIDEPISSVKPISEREMGGLQYLAGYVIRKLMLAAKKNDDDEIYILVTIRLSLVDADSEIIITIQVNGVSNFLYIQKSPLLLLNSFIVFESTTSAGRLFNHLQFYSKNFVLTDVLLLVAYKCYTCVLASLQFRIGKEYFLSIFILSDIILYVCNISPLLLLYANDGVLSVLISHCMVNPLYYELTLLPVSVPFLSLAGRV